VNLVIVGRNSREHHGVLAPGGGPATGIPWASMLAEDPTVALEWLRTSLEAGEADLELDTPAAEVGLNSRIVVL
jgi:hypothetical protein